MAKPYHRSPLAPSGTGFRHMTNGVEDIVSMPAEAAGSVATETAARIAADAGKQPLDAELTAIAGLTSAADKGVYFTGSGAAGTYDLTAAGRTLLAQATAALQRSTMGSTTVGDAVFIAATAAAARTALGLAAVAASGAASDISGLAAIATSGSATDLSGGTVPAARMPAHTGDATSPSGSVALTLANTAVTPATYGDATHVPQLTVDAKGRITGVTNVVISGGGGGSGDGLSTLVNSVNAITGAATLSLNTLNKCTGTSADYAATFPTAVGNGGKIIDVRGGTTSELTKVISLTPASGESIDSRAANAVLVLLANEYARFYSDNVQWWTVFHRFAPPQSFTPSIIGVSSNPTKATTHTDTAAWCRDGHDMLVNEYYYQAATTGAAAGSGAYKHTVPGGFSIDTSAVKVGTGAAVSSMGSVVGAGTFSYSGGDFPSTVRLYDSTSYIPWAYNGASMLPHGSTFFSYTLAELEYSLFARIPIANW